MAKYMKKNLSVFEKKLTKSREGRDVNRFAVGKFLGDVGLTADNFKASMDALTVALNQSTLAMLCPSKGGSYDIAVSVMKLLILLELNDARKAFLSDLVESSEKGLLTYDTFKMLIEYNLFNALLDNFEKSLHSKGEYSDLAIKSRHPLLPEYNYYSVRSLFFSVCDSISAQPSKRSDELGLKAARLANQLPIKFASKDAAGLLPTDIQWRKFKDSLFNFLSAEERVDFSVLRKSLITFSIGCKDWNML